MKLRALTLLLFALYGLMGLTNTALSAEEQKQEARILYHESVQSLHFTPAHPAPRAAGQEIIAGHLSFEAFEQQFDLILESNDRLIEDLPADRQARITASHQLYKGHIEGMEGSWVRLTRTGDQWTGLMWDGVTLYAIEPRETVADALQQTAVPPDHAPLVIYRLSDVSSQGSCALDPQAQPIHRQQLLFDELRQLVPALPAATSRLNVTVVGDQLYTQDQSNPEGRAVTLFNAVDGIYEDQVGVEIRVADIRLLQNNGNLTSSSPQQLLNQLSAFSNSSEIDNPGLVHLLTGRNLNGSTIGIAFLSSLCSERFGVGLSEIRNGGIALQTVLIAHELGHNFGAPHDNQGGSACASTPSGFIMNPVINSSFDTFSSCSINRMQPEIANAGCLVDIPGDDDDDDDDDNDNDDVLLSADFNSGRDSFAFEDDDTPGNARFTSGRRIANGGVSGSGALEITLGGIDNSTVTRMEANWTTRFSGSGRVTLSLDANLTQSPHYERSEFSEIGVILDGQLIALARIRGNGNGGPDRSTGFRSFSRNLDLGNGNHTLSLNCFNNRKTFRNERTTCRFDNVRIE